MADALTGKTEVDAVSLEDILSSQVQDVLTANAVMPGSILDMSADASPGKDLLKVPKFGNWTVDTKTENTAVDSQINALSTDDLALDQHKVIQWLIEKFADLQSMVNLNSHYLDQAGRDLASFVDNAVIDDMGANVSAAAPDHIIAFVTGTVLAKADITAARKTLSTAKVPLADRFCLVNEEQEEDLLNISEFTRVDEAGSSAALRNGEVGKLFGFTFLMSPNQSNVETLYYHRTSQAFALQQAPTIDSDKDLPNLAMRWSMDQVYGFKTLDSGKRSYKNID